eukprot:TRINITY_DN2713_c0_g1_i3.p2 TRINITY_DN2713_c0_g1~~TRINITY_DN2713_c0_g1_i3.p2  ORF type:complete len:316 (+),score=23.50 TRINITY_DN2713_c0_g1_i3:61-1008(+)
MTLWDPPSSRSCVEFRPPGVRRAEQPPPAPDIPREALPELLRHAIAPRGCDAAAPPVPADAAGALRQVSPGRSQVAPAPQRVAAPPGAHAQRGRERSPRGRSPAAACRLVPPGGSPRGGVHIDVMDPGDVAAYVRAMLDPIIRRPTKPQPRGDAPPRQGAPPARQPGVAALLSQLDGIGLASMHTLHQARAEADAVRQQLARLQAIPTSAPPAPAPAPRHHTPPPPRAARSPRRGAAPAQREDAGGQRIRIMDRLRSGAPTPPPGTDAQLARRRRHHHHRRRRMVRGGQDARKRRRRGPGGRTSASPQNARRRRW